MAKITVKCPVCEQHFDRNSPSIEAIKDKTRWYHMECYNEKVRQDAEKELAKEQAIRAKAEKIQKDLTYREAAQNKKIEDLDKAIEEKQQLRQKQKEEYIKTVQKKTEQLEKLKADTDSRRRLTDYVQSIFGDAANWPAVNNQIATFKRKHGLTEDDIYFTLKYFYEIRNGDKKKSNGGIGIVPYVHKEAMEYMANLAARRARIAKSAKPLTTEVRVVEGRISKESKKKEEIDLNDV